MNGGKFSLVDSSSEAKASESDAKQGCGSGFGNRLNVYGDILVVIQVLAHDRDGEVLDVCRGFK